MNGRIWSSPIELLNGAIIFQQVGEWHCQAIVRIVYEPPDNILTSLTSMNGLHNR